MSRARPPDVATQLSNAIDSLFNIKRREEQRKQSKALAFFDWLGVVFAPENLFAGMTLIFFVSVILIAALRTIQGSIPDYIGIIASSLIGLFGVFGKWRSLKQRESTSLNLVSSIMDRQFQYEQMKHEHEQSESKFDFFSQELIQLIASCELERLESINLALTALIYDKEGVIHKDLKQIKTLLASRHAAEESTIKKLNDIRKSLPKFDLLNGQRMEELREARNKIENLQGIIDKTSRQYHELMTNVDVAVVILNQDGIIYDANNLAKTTIPGIMEGMGQHWSWNMKDCPPKQVSAYLKLVNTALSGKRAEVHFKNYKYADGSKADQMRIRACPSKTGDLVDWVYLMIRTDGDGFEPEPDIAALHKLEEETTKKLEGD